MTAPSSRTDDERRFGVASGEVVELYEPPNSGQGPMQSGTCPGCGNQLAGFVGRCAAIRVLDVHGRPTTSSYATNYGHHECVDGLYTQLYSQLSTWEVEVTATPVQSSVRRSGTQRQFLDFLQARGHVDRVEFDVDAERDRRYRWWTS